MSPEPQGWSPVHPDEDKFFHTALDIVKSAGQLVRSAFEKPTIKVEEKTSHTDLVTETDRAVEQLLIGSLSQAFPNHKFIGEESVSGGQKIEYTDEPTWLIDPIDGTTNFVHRIPIIAICVGLAIKKQLRAGIVYNPITSELFSAQAGRGAFLNGFPIHVSSTKETSKAVVAIQLGSDRSEPLMSSFINNFKEAMGTLDAHGHRSFGSAALNMCSVAQGIVDAYVEYGVHAWDMAASSVILKEAGGVLQHPTGAPFDVMKRSLLCASTPELAEEFRSKLTHVEYEREA